MLAGRRTFRNGIALTALSVVALLALACGGPELPVTWVASIDGRDTVLPGSVVRIRVDARSARGWYFYSVTQTAGGPVAARIWLADSTTFRPAGAVSGSEPTRSFDETFGINVEKYPGAASFTLPVRVPRGTSGGAKEIRVNALYQACNDTVCLSPTTVTMTVPVTIESR